MNTENVIIVTSRDVEGLVCAAMIMRVEEMNCEVVLSDITSVWDDIEIITTSACPPERLYVTNIDPGDKSTDVLAKLTQSGTTMIWINGQYKAETYEYYHDMTKGSSAACESALPGH